MKVLLLSDRNSSHTIKWARSLTERGINVRIFGFSRLNESFYSSINNIPVITLNQNIRRKEGAFSKLKYLKALPLVKNEITKYKPDIVHAHYASSYGIIGSLCSFQPFILSVWGNDVFSFPKHSIFHKYILKYNLRKAFKILSTSHIMAKETQLYTDKEIEVTPFGIDLEQFKPAQENGLFDKNDIVIGTIKALEEKYGVEYLIRAFKILSDKYSQLPLKLLVVGGGTLEKKLKGLTRSLGIDKLTLFTGKVTYKDVVRYHNMLSVYVSVSISDSESFGVAIIEASACAKPVVVSNVGGLTEIVEDGITGYIVPSKSPEKTAEAIEMLILDKSLMNKLGEAGRSRVKKYYNWNDNVNQMVGIYKDVLNRKKVD